MSSRMYLPSKLCETSTHLRFLIYLSKSCSYMSKITRCLRDPCELVRRQTFILLGRLLQVLIGCRNKFKRISFLFVSIFLCNTFLCTARLCEVERASFPSIFVVFS